MFRNPFSFYGRIRRWEYVLSYFLYVISVLLLSIISETSEINSVYLALPMISFLYFMLAQGSKRCHDLGKSGFYQLIPFYVLVMLFAEGQKFENNYGSNPKRHITVPQGDQGQKLSFISLIGYTLPAVVLNILLVAIGINYLLDVWYYFFFWIVISIPFCHFLMLLGNGYRSTLDENRKLVLVQNLIFVSLLYSGIVFYRSFFWEIVFSLENIFFSLVAVFLIYILTIASYLFYYLLFRHRKGCVQTTRYHVLLSGIFVVSLLMVGFMKSPETIEKNPIIWSEREVIWDDFISVGEMEDEYVATITSAIACPDLITDGNSKVFAYMDPNHSSKLEGQYDSFNVLTHEQYHFNITEYLARCFRRDLVKKGLGGLSFATIKSLKTVYAKKLDSLQTVYDSITDHNANYELQRYWELQIDDWLRQTAYYSREDINNYYEFSGFRSPYFKNIYFTLNNKLLTAIPVGKEERLFGEVYEVEYDDSGQKIVKYYNNGELTNGGYFQTAIVKLVNKENGVHETHYLNSDESYNSDLIAAVIRTVTDSIGSLKTSYLDPQGNTIGMQGVYELHWDFDKKDSTYLSTSFDKFGKKVNKDVNVYRERRKLDREYRTIMVENLDRHGRILNDNDFIARYQFEYNDNHLKMVYKLFDESGSPAYHLDDFHLAYEYDRNGRSTRIHSKGEKGEAIYDSNGASVYEYTYDIYGRTTSVKRYNSQGQPIVANDDYHMEVKEYDSLGRVSFQGYYYPGYVMKFSAKKWGGTRYVYEGKHLIEEQNVDAYDNLINDVSGISIIRKFIDDNGNVEKEMYFDSEGNPARTQNGIVAYQYRFDKYGNEIEKKALDSSDCLRAFEDDIAIVRREFDNRGNVLKATYYNDEEKIIPEQDGVAIMTYSYDEKDRLILKSNYNQLMEPMEENGVFQLRYIKNEAGRDLVIQSFNKSGKLIKGACETHFSYNKYGSEVRKEFFDNTGKRTLNDIGVSAIETMYDKRHYQIGFRHFDVNDQLTNTTEGYAIEQYQIDELGHILTQTYYDNKGLPTFGPGGYHKLNYTWASVGEIVEHSTYDNQNNLVEDEAGIAIYRYDLATSGMRSSISRYDKTGNLSNNIDGVATTIYSSYLNGLYYLEKELDKYGKVVNEDSE